MARTEEATIIVGPLDIIEHADAAACALLGYREDEIVGTHGADLIPPERRPATAVSLDRMRHGQVTEREGWMRRKDGVVIAVEVTAQRLPDRRLRLTLRSRA
jgi:PAS domain S-box-containing protein